GRKWKCSEYQRLPAVVTSATTHAQSSACGPRNAATARHARRAPAENAHPSASSVVSTTATLATIVSTRKKLVVTSTSGMSAQRELSGDHGVRGFGEAHPNDHLPLARVGDVEERGVVVPLTELLQRYVEGREVG